MVLEGTCFDALLFDVVEMMKLWDELTTEKLIVLGKTGDVEDYDRRKLGDYLENKGVVLSREVVPQSDDMSYTYYAKLPNTISEKIYEGRQASRFLFNIIEEMKEHYQVMICEKDDGDAVSIPVNVEYDEDEDRIYICANYPDKSFDKR